MQIINLYNMQQQNLRMQEVKRQNQKMSRIIQGYLLQIQKYKQMNEKRQDQIENLLKFNERLLFVIQNQLAHNRRDTGSLMPISQKSQRQSDLMNPINSLIRTKKTFAPKSQYGSKSVIQHNTYLSRLQALGKHLQNSQFIRNQDIQDSFLYSGLNKSNLKIDYPQNQKKYSEVINKIQQQIQGEMKSFYSNAQKNREFYDTKMNQLNNLSSKIGIYKPQQKFSQIQRKVQMSPGTANLVKRAMMISK